MPAQRPTPSDYDHQNRTSPVVICRDELCVRTSDLGPERTNGSTAPTRIGRGAVFLVFLQQKRLALAVSIKISWLFGVVTCEEDVWG